MTTTHIAVALWTLAGILALVCFAIFIRRWDADAEATRAAHDADDFRAQLAAMTDAEVDKWHEWADVIAATDGEDTPIYAELTRERFIAGALAEIDRMTGGTAA